MLILVFVIPFKSFSTCIVIFKTENQIIVGADSKRTIHLVDSNGKMYESINNSYCKIHKVGKFYFVISGFIDSIQLEKATKACLSAKTINEVVELYTKLISVEFKKNIADYRKVSFEEYKKRFIGSDIGAISFFNFNKNTPKLITLYYKSETGINNEIEISTIKHEDKDITCLGMTDHINALTGIQWKELFVKEKGDYKNVIIALIKLEIQNHPKNIGGEIDILKITSKNDVWIKRKKNCN